MPPKKVKTLGEPSKASSSRAAPKAASRIPPRPSRASRASRSSITAAAVAPAPVAPAPVAPVHAPILNPDRDENRRTRANPSPRLKNKERKTGIQKEPSFARKKAGTIARTAARNAIAARNQEAEESTQPETASASQSPELEESRSTSPDLGPHSYISPASRMPGTFITEDPSSHQAAGPSKRVTRNSKRSRSQVSGDGSDGDNEGAGGKRPAKKARNDDPFEYFPRLSDSKKPEIQVNGAAINPTEQEVALERTEVIPTTPHQSLEPSGEDRPASAPSATNNDVSIYYTPQATEAAQAPQAAQADVVNETVNENVNEAAQEAVAEHNEVVQEPVVEHSEPEVGEGDQQLAVTATTPVQGPVNGSASASKSPAKSPSKLPNTPGYMKSPRTFTGSPDLSFEEMKKRRSRVEKSSASKVSSHTKWDLGEIYISDASDDEAIEPFDAKEMRVAKENSQRWLSVLKDQKVGKESMFVLRSDLQAKLDKKTKSRTKSRKQEGTPSASRPRKTQIPSAIISIHVQTQNGPEFLDVTPIVSGSLLKINRVLADNPGTLTADEAAAAVQAAIDAKLAPVSAQPTTTDQEAIVDPSSTGPSTQSQPMAAPASAPSVLHSMSILSPIREEEAEYTGDIIAADGGDTQIDREVATNSVTPFLEHRHASHEDIATEGRASESLPPKTPSSVKSGWLSALKTSVSKPLEYFGGSSHAGPSTADVNNSGSPSSFEPTTPTPGYRPTLFQTAYALFVKEKEEKEKAKAKEISEKTRDEWQTHVRNSKNKQRATVVDSIDDDDLPHNTYNSQNDEPFKPSRYWEPGPSSQTATEFVSKWPKGYVPPKDPVYGYITPRTFVVPDSSDDETEDEEDMDDQGFTMQVSKAEKQRLEAERAESERLAVIEKKRVEAERKEALRLEKHRRWIERMPENLSGQFTAQQNPLNTRDPYYWLRRARMVEMGCGYEGETTTDEMKGYLKIWHERMGTVGEFTLQEQAAEREAAEKEAAEKEAAEREAAEKEAREKEATEKEAAEKEAREQEAREKKAREEAEEEARALGHGHGARQSYPSNTSQGNNIAEAESEVFGRGQPLQEVATPNNSMQSFFDMARGKNAETPGTNEGAEDDDTEFSAATAAQQTQIEAARQQALKHQPKTSSNLQAMRRMSTPIQTPNGAPEVVIGHRDWDCPPEILAMPRPTRQFADLTQFL